MTKKCTSFIGVALGYGLVAAVVNLRLLEAPSAFVGGCVAGRVQKRVFHTSLAAAPSNIAQHCSRRSLVQLMPVLSVGPAPAAAAGSATVPALSVKSMAEYILKLAADAAIDLLQRWVSTQATTAVLVSLRLVSGVVVGLGMALKDLFEKMKENAKTRRSADEDVMPLLNECHTLKVNLVRTMEYIDEDLAFLEDERAKLLEKPDISGAKSFVDTFDGMLQAWINRVNSNIKCVKELYAKMLWIQGDLSLASEQVQKNIDESMEAIGWSVVFTAVEMSLFIVAPIFGAAVLGPWALATYVVEAADGGSSKLQIEDLKSKVQDHIAALENVDMALNNMSESFEGKKRNVVGKWQRVAATGDTATLFAEIENFKVKAIKDDAGWDSTWKLVQ